jgi:hypothetical protein
VASHFASLDNGDIELKIHPQHGLSSGGQSWLPSASFASAEVDALLYLTLGGGKGDEFPPPFLSHDKKMSTHEALLQIWNLHEQSSSQTAVGLTNSNALSRDGNMLEILATVSVEVASHRNGLGGINVVNFVLFLVEELLKQSLSLTWHRSNGLCKYLTPALYAKLSHTSAQRTTHGPTAFKSFLGFVLLH